MVWPTGGGGRLEQQQTAAEASRLQPLLGKFIRVKITRPMGSPYQGDTLCGVNFGEMAGPEPLCGKPDGVFILGIRHPVRYFDGRVIALVHSADGHCYAVAAPRKSRYIVGQIRRALRFVFPPEEEIRLQCLYERSCGAVVFRRAEGDLRFLLIKNHRSTHWGFPKGHVENFETAEQTARREVLEETGLRIRLLPGFSCQSEYMISGSIEKCVTIFLAETTDKRTTIQEAEIEDYIWVNYPKALQTLKFENDRNTLRKAWAYLRRQGLTGVKEQEPGVKGRGQGMR